MALTPADCLTFRFSKLVIREPSVISVLAVGVKIELKLEALLFRKASATQPSGPWSKSTGTQMYPFLEIEGMARMVPVLPRACCPISTPFSPAGSRTFRLSVVVTRSWAKTVVMVNKKRVVRVRRRVLTRFRWVVMWVGFNLLILVIIRGLGGVCKGLGGIKNTTK